MTIKKQIEQQKKNKDKLGKWIAPSNFVKNIFMRLSFPLLKKVIDFPLRNLIFRENLLRDALKNKDKGKHTFLDEREPTAIAWNKFFNETKLEEVFVLKSVIEENLDDLSREVIGRFLLQRFLHSLEGVVSFSQTGYQKPLEHFFPLDKTERERLNQLVLTIPKRYRFPAVVPEVEIVNGFGMSYFPKEKQTILLGRDVIDGGGFVGDSAMVFTEFQPRNVYVFEPNPDMFPEIKKIITLNTNVLGNYVHKIIPVQKALGRKQGSMKLYSRGIYDSMASINDGASFINRRNKLKEHEVPVVSIDDFVRKKSLDVGLIKLDVEGVESDVIEGAVETIKAHKPLLIISIYHNPKDFFEIKPKIESLNLGYHFLIRHLVSHSTGEFCLLGYPE
ncbi:MAG: FkbM family methyltransferase [Bacteroidales bacterium]|jgi:FkbM family methyltransferase|nr:FkbM family methyltransferase [Bacteroidales bacterium]